MKLATNSHHVSANCWRDFQGQKSRVKVTSRPIKLHFDGLTSRVTC